MTSLGATVVDGGTRFEVWAPGAERQRLVHIGDALEAAGDEILARQFRHGVDDARVGDVVG